MPTGLNFTVIDEHWGEGQGRPFLFIGGTQHGMTRRIDPVKQQGPVVFPIKVEIDHVGCFLNQETMRVAQRCEKEVYTRRAFDFGHGPFSCFGHETFPDEEVGRRLKDILSTLDPQIDTHALDLAGLQSAMQDYRRVEVRMPRIGIPTYIEEIEPLRRRIDRRRSPRLRDITQLRTFRGNIMAGIWQGTGLPEHMVSPAPEPASSPIIDKMKDSFDRHLSPDSSDAEVAQYLKDKAREAIEFSMRSKLGANATEKEKDKATLRYREIVSKLGLK